jgi:competence protein ComEC
MRQYRCFVLLVLLVFTLLTGCGLTTAPATLQAPAFAVVQPGIDTLRVHFIDVGQGDSILIQAPGGQTALIDGGYDNALALAYLQAQGIGRIDVMIASHPHADHIGGLVTILKSMPVGGVWTSGSSHTTGTFEALLDAITDAQVPYHEVTTGNTIALGQLQFAVLRGVDDASHLNDTSLVLRLADGHVSFLFTGDAERPSEAALLRDARDQLASTILKVGHHGSATSSSPPFLAAIHPQVAVYSAGRGNSYGHPHQETIRALAAAGATIYGTDRNGTVVVTTDGTSYTVTTERSSEAAVQPATSAAVPAPTATSAATAAPLSTSTPVNAAPAAVINRCHRRVDPASAPNGPIVIARVDKIAEVVTIKNTGAAAVDLSGWTICSLRGSQLHAVLSGTLAAGATLDIPSQAKRAIWNNRELERAAVYNSAGELIDYWSEEP